eukprot:TRINITY_DN5741_c0_g2_i1.p1 TRINITY_DN5741_c0_g2~~TRINITY_DN5741_c0_g2_i1.p1  ORF type:complete len:823 (-),score=115.86 TRINITY_DN5741_c0_g2_i1:240-2654(-)
MSSHSDENSEEIIHVSSDSCGKAKEESADEDTHGDHEHDMPCDRVPFVIRNTFIESVFDGAKAGDFSPFLPPAAISCPNTAICAHAEPRQISGGFLTNHALFMDGMTTPLSGELMLDSPLADPFASSGHLGAHESVMGFDPFASLTTNAAKAIESTGLTITSPLDEVATAVASAAAAAAPAAPAADDTIGLREVEQACSPPWGIDLMESLVGNVAGLIESKSPAMSSLSRRPTGSPSESAQSPATTPMQSPCLPHSLVAAGATRRTSCCEGADGQESSPPRSLPQSGEASQSADVSDLCLPLRGDHLIGGAAHDDEEVSAIPTADTQVPFGYVEEFVKTWHLDSRCRAMIAKVWKTASPEEVVRILRDFDASRETKNANAKFMVWFGSRLRRLEAKAESGDMPCGATTITEKDETATDVEALEEFCNRWSLSKRTRSYVKKLSPPVQHTLVQTFDPPADTRNMDAMLFAFVRNRIAKDEKGPLPKPPNVRDAREVQVMRDKYVEDFSRKMRLDGISTNVLREFAKHIPEASWADLRHQRGMPADNRNAPQEQGMDQKISKETLKSTQTSDEFCDSFVTKWELDARCRTVMEELRKEVSEDEFRRLLAKFCVSSDTLNAKAKFMVWIDIQTRRFAAARLRASETVAVSKEELTAFLNHWVFCDEAQREIRSLQPQLLRNVINDFKPPADTKSVDAKLFAFIRLQRQKAATKCLRFAGLDEVGQQEIEDFDGGGLAKARVTKLRRDAIITEFTEIWGLTASSVALLRSMSFVKLAHVVKHFLPVGKTDSIDKAFSYFVSRLGPIRT